MAEVVEKFLEEVFEECSILLKTELFSLDEIRKFVKTRRALLYKAERKEKRPVDYMALINFELQFFALLGLRRKAKNFFFNKSIERRLIQRINRLYKVLCFRFQDQVPFWLSHLSFCRRLGRYKAVDRGLARMLQMHSEKVALWSMAARWHFHERPNVRMEVRRRAMAARQRRKRLAERKGKQNPDTADSEEEEEKEKEEEEEAEEEEEEEEESEEESENERDVRLGTIEDGIKAARETFIRGLKLNPTSGRLHIDYFAFELDVADWTRWRRSQGITNRKLPEQTQEDLCRGELAGIVWGTIRSQFEDSVSVVTECAELVKKVGWPKAEKMSWAEEILELKKSRSEKEPPTPASPVSFPAPALLSSPSTQVAAFDTALAREGSAGARRVWEEAARAGWPSVELLLRLVRLESAQLSPEGRLADLRKAFELVASSSGARSKEFWLAYVAFEERNDPLRIPGLDWRARKALSPKDLNAFTVSRVAPRLLSC